MEISNKKRPHSVEGISVKEIGGETIIVTDEGNWMHTLDTTASFIWKLIEEGRESAEIALLVAGRYSIPEERASSDVNEFLEELRKKGLIHF